jgi:hypothetical protein
VHFQPHADQGALYVSGVHLLKVVLHASQTADSGKNNSSWRKARLQAQELTLVVVENRECMLDGESDAKT